MNKNYLNGLRDGFIFQKEKKNNIDININISEDYIKGFNNGILIACAYPNISLGNAIENNFINNY